MQGLQTKKKEKTKASGQLLLIMLLDTLLVLLLPFTTIMYNGITLPNSSSCAVQLEKYVKPSHHGGPEGYYELALEPLISMQLRQASLVTCCSSPVSLDRRCL